jgi:hypothetical protein
MNTQTALAARELTARGVRLRPGMSIEFVLRPKARAKGRQGGAVDYAVEEYARLVLRAAGEIVEPLAGLPVTDALSRSIR